MIELDIATAETIGTRAEQQDAAAIVRIGEGGEAALLVLADGLGGHADGAQAARIVIETFRERATGGFGGLELSRDALDQAIEDANGRIRSAGDPMDERGMGSTAVAAVIAEGRLLWVSVGDSHLYVWRRGRLAKLNADHSRAGMMIRQGHAPDEPAVLEARSLLASALLGRAIEEIDKPAASVALAIGDVILLASDGLDVLSDAEIAHTIAEGADRGADATSRALIAAVLGLGLSRQDNATVVTARVLGSGALANPDDELPRSVIRPGPSAEDGPRSGWPLAIGLAVLAAILLSVIMTQMQ
jgi:serine/threonine protein phosphatase PrpC